MTKDKLPIDILPTVNGEDSFVGRRGVPSGPGRQLTLSAWRVSASCATHQPSTQGYGVFGVRGGCGIRLCRIRYRLNRGVQIPATHPPMDSVRTRVVSSTVLHHDEWSAIANGACFAVLSPPRVCGNYHLVMSRSSVRMADEPQPRTLHQVCRWEPPEDCDAEDRSVSVPFHDELVENALRDVADQAVAKDYQKFNI